MDKRKRIARKLANIIGGFALTIAYFSANGHCTFIYHEVDMPEEVKRLNNAHMI